LKKQAEKTGICHAGSSARKFTLLQAFSFLALDFSNPGSTVARHGALL
jgi:hypothetical protein